MVGTRSPSADQRSRLAIGGVLAEALRSFGQAPAVYLLVGVASRLPSIVQLLVAGEAAAEGFAWVDVIVFALETAISALTDTAVIALFMSVDDRGLGALGEALRQGVRRYWPMLGVTIVTQLAFYGGVILLVAPALFFVTLFAVAGPACVMESLGPVASLRRSAQLTEGSRWRILGLALIVFMPAIAVILLIVFAPPSSALTHQWILTIFTVFWDPIATIVSAATYVALRRLKKNVGVARVFD